MRPHILFADDDYDIRELVELILETAGFRVSSADNAAEVLRLVTTEQFDALLLDQWLSDITGIELCHQIRLFDHSTPILICSGAVSAADENAVVLAGAQGYVGKPFTSQDLIRRLRSVIKINGVN